MKDEAVSVRSRPTKTIIAVETAPAVLGTPLSVGELWEFIAERWRIQEEATARLPYRKVDR